jgi:hypothetical protein
VPSFFILASFFGWIQVSNLNPTKFEVTTPRYAKRKHPAKTAGLFGLGIGAV